MNKTSIFQKPWLLSVGLMVPTLMTLASMPANALDLGGFTNTGYTASFQSDTVPEPLTMLGAGAALGFGSFFKRKLGKNNKQNKA